LTATNKPLQAAQTLLLAINPASTVARSSEDSTTHATNFMGVSKGVGRSYFMKLAGTNLSRR